MTPREALDLLGRLPIPDGTKIAEGAKEALATLEAMIKPATGMECWFCREPAVTIGYGFAVCGGRPDGEVNCSERARKLAITTVSGHAREFAIEAINDGRR